MVFVANRVPRHHPEISKEDAETAWENAAACIPRSGGRPFEYVAVGFDGKGRAIEIVGRMTGEGDWIVWHAMTPPTKKTLRELGLRR